MSVTELVKYTTTSITTTTTNSNINAPIPMLLIIIIITNFLVQVLPYSSKKGAGYSIPLR